MKTLKPEQMHQMLVSLTATHAVILEATAALIAESPQRDQVATRLNEAVQRLLDVANPIPIDEAYLAMIYRARDHLLGTH